MPRCTSVHKFIPGGASQRRQGAPLLAPGYRAACLLTQLPSRTLPRGCLFTHTTASLHSLAWVVRQCPLSALYIIILMEF